MKTYLVGGAVRDMLLGRPPKDRDFVVMDATATDLLDAGFTQVGRGFPVFLHPETREQYALPRREHKTGPGHADFSCETDGVTLEEDLRRRDLTINAMALEPGISWDGLIDPFGGEADLASGQLRHVDPDGFREDPLRVLRVARFAAELGFYVSPVTMDLMSEMVSNGEMRQLTGERVVAEILKGLAGPTPSAMFEVLHKCGALREILPELDALRGVPQPVEHHPEVDSFRHVMLALDVAAESGYSTAVRFAVLLHDLGKGTTPPEEWPRHVAHEERGVALVRDVCNRLPIPGYLRTLAMMTSRHHLRVHRAMDMRPIKVVKFLREVDAFRKPSRFAELLQACRSDALGRWGKEGDAYPQEAYLAKALAEVKTVDQGAVVRACAEKGWPSSRIPLELNAALADALRHAPALK